MVSVGDLAREERPIAATDTLEFPLSTSPARRTVVQRIVLTVVAGTALGLIAWLLGGTAAGAWFLAAALVCVVLLGWLCRVLRNYAVSATALRVEGDVVFLPKWTNPQEHKAYPLSDLYWVEHKYRKDPMRGAVCLAFRKHGFEPIPGAAFASEEDIRGFVEAMRRAVVRHEGGDDKLKDRQAVARRFGQLQPAALTIAASLVIAYAVHWAFMDQGEEAANALYRAMVGPSEASAGYEFLRIGGLSGYLLASGEHFRLATAAFAHVSLLHLWANVCMTILIGSLLEPVVRKLNVSVIFLASALGGALCSAFGSIEWSRYIVSVGASGGVYGLIGAFIYIRLKYLDHLPLQVRGHRFFWIFYCSLLVDLAYGFWHQSVDVFAHIGGFLTGLLSAALLARNRTMDSLGEASLLRQVILAGLLVVYSASFGMLYATNKAYDPVTYREALIDRVLADERSPSDGIAFVRYADMLEFTVDRLLEDESPDRARLELARRKLERVISLAPERSAERLHAIDARLGGDPTPPAETETG